MIFNACFNKLTPLRAPEFATSPLPQQTGITKPVFQSPASPLRQALSEKPHHHISSNFPTCTHHLHAHFQKSRPLISFIFFIAPAISSRKSFPLHPHHINLSFSILYTLPTDCPFHTFLKHSLQIPAEHKCAMNFFQTLLTAYIPSLLPQNLYKLQNFVWSITKTIHLLLNLPITASLTIFLL